MSYTFGKPKAAPPYSSAGEFKSEPFVLSLMTRMKLVVRPASSDKVVPVGTDVSPDFEPLLRQAVAEALIGASGGGFEVVYAAVEQFEDAGS